MAGLLGAGVVDRVQAAVDGHAAYVASIESRCFLDDTTAKNAIVHNRRLSGIVDVDVVCFGDPLRTPALTRMALLALGYDTEYVDYWAGELAVTDEQRSVLAVYTACTA